VWNLIYRDGEVIENMLINWQYCKDPNDINNAILHGDTNWEGLVSSSDIISITYDTNHGCYVVFWKVTR